MNLDALLREQIAHAYENAPAIRNMMDAAGVAPDYIRTVSDLAKIPVTSKDKLQAMQQENPPFGGFLAVPLRQLRRIYVSPGPIYDPHGFGEELAYQSGQEAFAAAGFSEDDIVLNTFSYHMVPAGLLLDEVLAALGATVIPTGPGNTEFQVKVILDLQVTAYVGTPSFLQMIYEKAEGMGIPPHEMPLKRTFFSAEAYLPQQRQFFEETYGLITSQAYATADLGIIGFERRGYSGLYLPQALIVQICDPQSGEELPEGQMGEVVVTTFNKTYPLVRFGTGDLSILQSETDQKGRVHRKLLGIMGRSGEAIKVRGMFLHPNALKKASAQFENIKRIQAIVDRENTRDTFTVLVELSSGQIDPEAVRQAVKEAARLSVDAVEVVAKIEGTRLVVDRRKYT